ncbi:MAG: hypothetical protein AUH07_05140 [Gemmatimonadetes bacterium 13_2_20CM_70_9]|nr:MAG: hypothetical protein AUH07_05140 [Gemmatimonadetes bacterium 13_2_20CM_70_9]
MVSEGTSRADTATEPTAGSQPSDALLKALRELIREEWGRPLEAAASPGPSASQAIVLLFLAVDLALLLNLFSVPGFVGERTIEVAKTVVPLLFGSALVLYLDRMRHWLLTWCGHTRVKWITISLVLPLLLPQILDYSVPVALVPERLELYLDGKPAAVERRGTVYVLSVPGLRPFQLKVRDPSGGKESVDSFPLTRWTVLQGTLSQAPVIGGLFSRSALTISTKYPVEIEWSGGAAVLEIAGTFSDRFLAQTTLQLQSRAGARMTLRHDTDPDPEMSSDVLDLPPGRYDFTMRRARELCGVSDSTKTQSKEVAAATTNRVHFDIARCPARR